MNNIYEGQELSRVTEARESFSGRLLTDDQFNEAMAITGIVEKQIQKTGTFKDKLGDYANAFARSEKFNMIQAESIVRDLFKIRTGKTMNQMRENLIEQEDKLLGKPVRPNGKDDEASKSVEPTMSDAGRNSVYQATTAIGEMVESGDKMTFYRAYSHQAAQLAQDFGITEMGARRVMRNEFKAVENQELLDWGKELDNTFYKPQIEAEKAQRSKQTSADKTKDKTKDKSERGNEQSVGEHGDGQADMSFDRSR